MTVVYGWILVAMTASEAATPPTPTPAAPVAPRDVLRRVGLVRKAAVIDNNALLELIRKAKHSRLSQETAASGEAAVESEPPPAPPAAEPTPARTEAYWRARMADAAKRIRTLESDINWAKQRILSLRQDLVVPNDGAREFNRKIELDQAMKEQSLLEQQLEDARALPDAIQEEGRKAGVLPGWFR